MQVYSVFTLIIALKGPFDPVFAQMAAVTAAKGKNYFGDSGNVVRRIVRLRYKVE
jgi:hypothetical protein